jgi:dipeptide transport system permease protein
MIPTFLGVTLIAFSLIHLIPGDPVEAMMGERGINPARHAELKAKLGLDQPLAVQYFTYLKNVAQGNFGTSVVTNEPVLKEFFSRFPATVELSLLAILLATLIGVPAGVIAATRRGKLADHGLMGAALTGYSMPIFWWGLLLILLFSVTLGWTPVSGRIGFAFDVPPRTGFLLVDSLLSGEAGAFKSALSHLILPTIVLATVPLAVIARMTRSSMLEVLREDYIRAARAKGVSRAKLIFVHALRNALIPVVTVIGLQVGALLSGAILTETIFSWPGIGKWLIESIGRRDYQVVQGGILLIATLIIVVNLLVDVLYGVINPRIRSSH